MIVEAQNTKTFGLDDRTPPSVGCLLGRREMLAPIEFDDELGGMTYEIGDVGRDRHLASEAGAVQAVIAQR
jgi:hypothetical protein